MEKCGGGGRGSWCSALAGLVESLKDGGSLVVAEGYMWETERRGYLQLGSFLPEVVLEKPSMIKALHEEFVYCGSDVVEAFTVCIMLEYNCVKSQCIISQNLLVISWSGDSIINKTIVIQHRVCSLLFCYFQVVWRVVLVGVLGGLAGSVLEGSVV